MCQECNEIDSELFKALRGDVTPEQEISELREVLEEARKVAQGLEEVLTVLLLRADDKTVEMTREEVKAARDGFFGIDSGETERGTFAVRLIEPPKEVLELLKLLAGEGE